MSDAKRALIAADLERETQDKSLHSIHNGLLSAKVWYLGALYTAFTIRLYAVSFWLSSIIKASGVKTALIVGLLTAFPMR